MRTLRTRSAGLTGTSLTGRSFLTIDESFFSHPPLQGSGILSVQEYGKAVAEGKEFGGITPMEVADELDRISAGTIEGLEGLRRSDPDNAELQATLGDMESMAAMGRYYADKIRGAAALAVYREDPSLEEYHDRSVDYLTLAVEEWEAYARIATSQYKPQLFSRSHYMDWWRILEEVKKEVELVK